ncbi:nuclear pore glycoprotein p62 [Plutella xylostella]|uniref:nuclear pore glycoprotein p62 n=1 Tax=Plutella xylostella TaxID=51655 RepID=UPI002032AB36|nr:nuclear pore glycoprotein p62 [Plutella xylostella]
MNFSFGAATTTAAATPAFGASTPAKGFAFGGGDTKPGGLFGGTGTDNKSFNFTSPTQQAQAAPASGAVFGGNSSFSFGAKTTASTGLFGTPPAQTQAAAPAFGGFASPPNQTVGSPGFGQPAAQTQAQNVSFGGASTQQPTLGFGSPQAQAPSALGQAFSSPQGGFAFGKTAAPTSQPSGFGGFSTPASGFSMGMQPATSTTSTAPQSSTSGMTLGSSQASAGITAAAGQGGAFGTAKPAGGFAFGGISTPSFGAATTAPPSFAQATATSAAPAFGATSAVSFAATTAPPAFGTATAAPASSAPTFGQAQPTSGFSFAAKPATTATGLSFNPTSTGLGLNPTSSAGLTITPASTGLNLTPASTGLSLGGGLSMTPASTGLTLGTPASTGLTLGTPASTGLTLGTPASTGLGLASSGGLTLGSSSAATSLPSFGVASSAGATPQAGGLNFSSAVTSTAPAAAAPAISAAGFQLGQKPATSIGFGLTSTASSLPSSTASSSAPSGITALGAKTSTAVTSMPSLTATTTAAPVAPTAVTSISFAQLEENINKWTIELEEQEKTFINQATQINAWDRLLIANGEKIVELNEAVQSVKNQQQTLEHECEFVLAQQKELQDMLAPLESCLQATAPTDPHREHMYSLAENLDSQLRQMSEDLKEVIEHLNETNRGQDSSDPIVQIGRILNAHMSSMQWVDNSIAQISTKLDQLKTTHDTLRRDNERSFQLTYN